MGIGMILGWAVFGLVAGAIARLLHPGRDPMNWLWTMLLGVGGALTGGFIGDAIGVNTSRGLMSWIAAIGGALLLLIFYYMATARRVAPISYPAPGSEPATNDEYKHAVFDDLARGPNG